MKKILTIAAMLTALATPCCAQQLTSGINDIGVDRFAHFGVSYVIADQLHKNCGMNRFWAGVTTIAIGAAKEKWMDNHFDKGDFAADCAGALFVNVKF